MLFFKPGVFILLAAGLMAADFQTTLLFPPYFHSYGIQRADQKKLFLLLPFRTRFDNPQGLAVTRMNARNDAATGNDDDEVTVYGVNSGRGELIYNTSMYGITLWGSRGAGREQMYNPKGVACDPKGNVYVCDAGNNRIVHLFNSKTKVQFVNHLGVGLLKNPTHLALGGEGEIYVSDTEHDRILILKPDGRIIREIRQAGKIRINRPLGLAVNLRNEKWICEPKPDSVLILYHQVNYLFFLNDSGKRLVRFNLDNQETRILNPDSQRQFHCTYDFMATDFYGNIYLTDRVRGGIDKYDMELNWLTTFGRTGHGEREFDEPRGICIWKRFGQTFVAEKNGAQYYWIGTDFSGVCVKRNSDHLQPGLFSVQGAITEPSYLSLYLLSDKKDTLETLFEKRFILPRFFESRFNGNQIQRNGVEWLCVFEPTYSSYTYFKKPLYIKTKNSAP